MRYLKKKLPGINGIITFEAAARHLSFTAAAAELCVSQAAVSGQIRRLEERLGVALFQRTHRSLRLTNAGHKLYLAVTMGLEHIANTASEISQVRQGGQIQVAASVAFATFWLMPRLHAFRNAFPEVNVRVLASDRRQDQFSKGVDIVLACGDVHLPGQTSYFLFSEQVFPVCSPAYLGDRRLRWVQELLGERLLHLDNRLWDDLGWEPIDWSLWLAQFGVHYQPTHPLLTFNNYPMLVQAAVDGQGIALGWLHLLEAQLAEGKLVRPLAECWDARRGYYLVVTADPPMRDEIAALRDWLLADRSC